MNSKELATKQQEPIASEPALKQQPEQAESLGQAGVALTEEQLAGVAGGILKQTLRPNPGVVKPVHVGEKPIKF
ncbi:hypothetical protein [Castellaniella denitrificans]|uniref:hypothetical protein n=1 Tax=Castellaniella denitrificans TaxID=56119 RepID=UPI001AD2DAE7|nr:hypothetical protein [Burkholderiales bacterium]